MTGVAVGQERGLAESGAGREQTERARAALEAAEARFTEAGRGGDAAGLRAAGRQRSDLAQAYRRAADGWAAAMPRDKAAAAAVAAARKAQEAYYIPSGGLAP